MFRRLGPGERFLIQANIVVRGTSSGSWLILSSKHGYDNS